MFHGLPKHFYLDILMNDKIPSLNCLLDSFVENVVRNTLHEGPSTIVDTFSPQALKMVKPRGFVAPFPFIRGDILFNYHVVYKPIMSAFLNIFYSEKHSLETYLKSYSI